MICWSNRSNTTDASSRSCYGCHGIVPVCDCMAVRLGQSTWARFCGPSAHSEVEEFELRHGRQVEQRLDGQLLDEPQLQARQRCGALRPESVVRRPDSCKDRRWGCMLELIRFALHLKGPTGRSMPMVLFPNACIPATAHRGRTLLCSGSQEEGSSVTPCCH